jgi:hypothetical protein
VYGWGGGGYVRPGRPVPCQVELDPASAGHVMTDLPQLLAQALYRENQTKAWCESCRKYQHTLQTRPLDVLPSAFAINCALPVTATTPTAAGAGAPVAGTGDAGDDDDDRDGTAGTASSSLPTSLAVACDTSGRWTVRGHYGGGLRTATALLAKFDAVARDDGGGDTAGAQGDGLWADSELLEETPGPRIADADGAAAADNAPAAATPTPDTVLYDLVVRRI